MTASPCTCSSGDRRNKGGLQELPPDHHTTTCVADAAGLVYTRLFRWVESGRLMPSIYREGSGASWGWSDNDLAYVTRIARRLAWGMTLDAAFRDDDPPLPPPRTRHRARPTAGPLFHWRYTMTQAERGRT